MIVGTVTEAPANETADITIRMNTSEMQVALHRGDMGQAWYEDDNLREDMERGGE